MMSLTKALLVASTCLLAESLAAQDTTTASCWFDTLGHTFRDTVAIAIAPLRSKSQTANTDYLLIAQTIRENFQAPAAVHLPLWARTVPSAQSILPKFPFPDSLRLVVPAPYGLDGYILFRLNATGRLADSTIVVQIASPELRDAILAAIRRADSTFAFGPPGDDVRHDGGRVRLEFVQLPYRLGPSIPLLRVQVPAIKIEQPPQLLSFPTMKYPSSARAARVGDHIVLRFAVGADGRMIPGTMDLLEAGYRDFAEEVIREAVHFRFQPAHVGACALPTLVRLPINFTIRD